MTLESAYFLSQIAASAAVVLTLAAVVFSMRQNTLAQRSVAVQSLTAAITAINVPGSGSPALGNALSSATRDWTKATRDERILTHYFLFSFFKLCEQAWYQHQYGILDEGQWTGWESSLMRFYHSPGVKDGWWPGRRISYSPAFQSYLAASPLPEWTAATSLYDLFEGIPMTPKLEAGPS